MKLNMFAAAAASALLLAGCTGTGAQEIAPNTEPEETADPAETEIPESKITLVGGWVINTEAESMLSDEERELFAEAIEGLDGAAYTPVSVLAEQVVSGMNYAYLCTSKTITADPQYWWSVVVVYKDLDGNATIMNIQHIDPTDPMTSDEPGNDDLTGGWTVLPAKETPAMMPNEEAQAAVEAAAANAEDITLAPIALLSTQLVSGTNYKVLMHGTAEGQDSPSLYITTIYRDLKGNCSITDNQLLDLPRYVDMTIYD